MLFESFPICRRWRRRRRYRQWDAQFSDLLDLKVAGETPKPFARLLRREMAALMNMQIDTLLEASDALDFLRLNIGWRNLQTNIDCL